MESDNSAVESIWHHAAKVLRDDLGDTAWQTCFAGIQPKDLVGDEFTLAVPADLIRARIEAEYLAAVEDAVSAQADRRIRVRIVTEVPRRSYLEDLDIAFGPEFDEPEPEPQRQAQARLQQVRGPLPTANLPVSPTNTFETFVIGDSNRFAHGAALAVAESPGQDGYNPLFIYGPTGLGKTHLMHAIVNLVRRTSSLRATYTTSEQFTNEFIEMIQSGRKAEFRERYRSTDLLLIDDIQFLERKIETQNEFFHTFNTLHSNFRQIVVASDRQPLEISDLTRRLQTRLAGGIMADINPPELETRIAILHNKAARWDVEVPDDVLELIAQKIFDNIRELEGALNRVKAYASVEGVPISRDLAEDLLAGMGDANRKVTSDDIMRHTAAYYDVTIEDLIGPSKQRSLALARQVAMYLHRNLTELSTPRIGEIFGNRDHTTVLHAQKTVTNKMDEQRPVFQQVTELTNQIKSSR
ncbi:MAG: chromosomal replication initiator protein DnaA [Acidimicrobiia bacterium]|nr:chromosomal replication initiator protein DnaA [Acidimicrobiia bacterium]